MLKLRRIKAGDNDYRTADAGDEYWAGVDMLRRLLKDDITVSFLFEPGNGTAMEILIVPMTACANYGAWRGADEDFPGDWFWVSIICGPGAGSQVVPRQYLDFFWVLEHFGLTKPDIAELTCLFNDIFKTFPPYMESDTVRREMYAHIHRFAETASGSLSDSVRPRSPV